MNIAEVIGGNIQRLMDEQSISTVDMAKMLGITRQTLMNYLKGMSIIDSAKLSVIANFFHKNIEYFLQEEPERHALLFRTALAYEEAGTSVYDRISNFMQDYYHLAKLAGEKLSYQPEQYNLTVEYNNDIVNINNDNFNYFDAKLTRELENEIEYIANDQRKRLGIEKAVGLDIVKALQDSGIRIIFQKMNNEKLFGISAVPEDHGCFIFINDDDNIPLERKLFSVAHEYGHIIMHRSIFTKRLEDRYKEHYKKTKKKNLYEDMANVFAGFFLCPKSLLVKYDSVLNKKELTLADFISIKSEFQISLMSFAMTINKYGYINDLQKRRIFEILCQNGFRTKEPYPIIEDEEVKQNFSMIKNAKLLNLLRKLFIEDKITLSKVAEMLDINITEARRRTASWTYDEGHIEGYISEPIK